MVMVVEGLVDIGNGFGSRSRSRSRSRSPSPVGHSRTSLLPPGVDNGALVPCGSIGRAASADTDVDVDVVLEILLGGGGVCGRLDFLARLFDVLVLALAVAG